MKVINGWVSGQWWFNTNSFNNAHFFPICSLKPFCVPQCAFARGIFILIYFIFVNVYSMPTNKKCTYTEESYMAFNVWGSRKRMTRKLDNFTRSHCLTGYKCYGELCLSREECAFKSRNLFISIQISDSSLP